jgi:hypothetical protein
MQLVVIGMLMTCLESESNQTTVVVERDCTGGKADDIGDTWDGLLSSKLTEVFAVEVTLELGVDGVTPVAETLPMNHDYEQVDQ